MKVQRSKLLDELYGENESKRVYDMLNDLDSTLNESVQAVAYDYFWALKGLSIRDKSLISLVTLVALGKEPQLRSHMIGFLNTGGTPQELMGVLLFVRKNCGVQSINNCFNILLDVLAHSSEFLSSYDELQSIIYQCLNDASNLLIQSLQFKDQCTIKLAFNVAVCMPDNILISMNDFLREKSCGEYNLRCVLMHQIVYCGFPTVINAFGILKKILKNN